MSDEDTLLLDKPVIVMPSTVMPMNSFSVYNKVERKFNKPYLGFEGQSDISNFAEEGTFEYGLLKEEENIPPPLDNPIADPVEVIYPPVEQIPSSPSGMREFISTVWSYVPSFKKPIELYRKDCLGFSDQKDVSTFSEEGDSSHGFLKEEGSILKKYEAPSPEKEESPLSKTDKSVEIHKKIELIKNDKIIPTAKEKPVAKPKILGFHGQKGVTTFSEEGKSTHGFLAEEPPTISRLRALFPF